MSNFVGDFNPGATVWIPFTTVTTAGVGAQLSGSPTARVFAVNAASALNAGVSLIVNFGSTTGRNMVKVDLSTDTVAYAASNDYTVTITSGIAGGTGGVVVTGYEVGHFSIRNRSLQTLVSGVNLTTVNGLAAVNSLALGNVNVVQIAQLGTVSSLALGQVNAVQVAGQATPTSFGLGNVNAVQINGVTAVTSLASGNVSATLAGSTSTAQFGVNIVTWLGDAPARLLNGTLVQAAASGGVNATQIAGVTTPTSLALGNVNAVQINGVTAVTSLALGNVSAVLSGSTSVAQFGVNIVTVAGQAVATSGVLDTNVVTWLGAAPLILRSGTVQADVERWTNQVVATPVISGIPQVDVVGWQNTTANTSFTTGNVNVVSIQGVGAATSLALGNVNAVQIAGQATPTSFGLGNTNTVKIAGIGAVTSLALGNVNAVTIPALGNVTVGGYAAGQDPATLLLATPANKLATDASGNVTTGTLAPLSILTGSFRAGALATTVFPSNVFTSALFDTTAANQFADALLDRTNGVESGVTPRQQMRAAGAALAGVTSGALTAQFGIFGMGNTTQRIVAATDNSGNRLGVTLNL